jgi:predicted permease
MGIRLVRGRDFTDADRGDAPWVAVISAAMAEKFWPGADPIGRRVGLPIATSPWMTIVGVVDDVKQDSLNAPRRLTLYRPFAQATNTDNTVVARVTGDPAAFASAMRAATAGLDRTVPVSDIRTVPSIVSASLARTRFTATLLTAFALLALTLGAVGVYGVVSYVVTERTREMGVRIALGATPARVLALVVARGASLAATGAALGIAGALAAAHALAGLLYGVTTTDLVTFTAAPAVLVAVALVATWLPARRAVRADPLTALRAE